jgi:hypothetical protein
MGVLRGRSRRSHHSSRVQSDFPEPGKSVNARPLPDIMHLKATIPLLARTGRSAPVAVTRPQRFADISVGDFPSAVPSGSRGRGDGGCPLQDDSAIAPSRSADCVTAVSAHLEQPALHAHPYAAQIGIIRAVEYWCSALWVRGARPSEETGS